MPEELMLYIEAMTRKNNPIDKILLKYSKVKHRKNDFKDIIALIIALAKTKRTENLKIIVKSASYLIKVINNESPFELFAGTEFSNEEPEYMESELTPYASRKQVYSALKDFVKAKEYNRIISEINQRYPADKWNDSLPILSMCNLIANQHLDDLV